ncbi:response regulator [Streptacidiphilus sp. 4-A2]|nr:response regulator [Streptacidiphilus sp. 4-A2]
MTRILVVDDPPSPKSSPAICSAPGTRERAEDGAAALERVAANRPDLVVLDLMLPVVDGLEICRRLRADRVTRALPVVMLTAKGDEQDRILGLELGADDYVTKPFSPRELMLRIQSVLRRSASPPPPPHRNRCAPGTSPSTRPPGGRTGAAANSHSPCANSTCWPFCFTIPAPPSGGRS